jgi:hypothetical protein
MNIDQENTLRALKDEPLIVNSWLCRWGWHRWTQWSEVYLPKGGNANVQHAHCACCNKMRVHKVKDQNGRTV